MTSQLHQKPTFPGSIVKSRLCVSGTNLIPSASTEKRKERARELKVYPSTLRYASFLHNRIPRDHPIFSRSVRFFRLPHPLGLRVGTTLLGQTENEHWWTSWWTMQRQNAMQKRNSRSFNPSEGREEEILYTPKGRCEGESGNFEVCCFRPYM